MVLPVSSQAHLSREQVLRTTFCGVHIAWGTCTCGRFHTEWAVLRLSEKPCAQQGDSVARVHDLRRAGTGERICPAGQGPPYDHRPSCQIADGDG